MAEAQGVVLQALDRAEEDWMGRESTGVWQEAAAVGVTITIIIILHTVITRHYTIRPALVVV